VLIDAGIQGLQGFQPECGLILDELVQRRTRDGESLVIFGPLAVTTELPVWNPRQVFAAVEQALEICRGRANLVLFTANAINPDVPLENVRAMYEAAGAGQAEGAAHTSTAPRKVRAAVLLQYMRDLLPSGSLAAIHLSC